MVSIILLVNLFTVDLQAKDERHQGFLMQVKFHVVVRSTSVCQEHRLRTSRDKRTSKGNKAFEWLLPFALRGPAAI